MKKLLGILVLVFLLGPGFWTILVWICEWLNIFQEFVELYQKVFPKSTGNLILIYIFLSTLLSIIVIAFNAYLISSELIEKYKKNK